MDLAKILKFFIPIVFYVTIVIVFLVKLSDLNSALMDEIPDAFFMDILQYSDWLPIKFFGFTLVLGVIGILIIIYCCYVIRNSYTDPEEMIASLLSIVICAVILILLVKFISVPILKAVFLATVALAGGAYTMSKK